jgi:hypothetical protein
MPALAQLNSAEINQQILAAHAHPRQIVPFRRNMRALVEYDTATAISCLYALKRGNKVIEGPSIRFAEAALQCWGNARAAKRPVDIGTEFVTAQGLFYDLERNVAIAFEVMRRITDKEGNRFNEDMIGVTMGAAGSIAYRNAILAGIPKIAWNEAYQSAKNLAIGRGESITVKRDAMLKAFAPVGVDPGMIFALLGVKGVDDVSIENMILLAGILNRIRDGETTVEREFDPKNFERTDGGVIVPPKPERSAFERKEDAPAAQTETKAANVETRPAAQEAKADPDAEQRKWYEEQKGLIAECKTVRALTELRDATLPGLSSAAQEKEWLQLCADAQDGILSKTRKTR